MTDVPVPGARTAASVPPVLPALPHATLTRTPLTRRTLAGQRRAAGLDWWAAGREAGLLVLLYVGYTVARLLGTDDHAAALARGVWLHGTEHALHLGASGLVAFVAAHTWLALAVSFWYAAAHYLVTPLVLALLWWRRPSTYRRARTALVLATVVALACYLLLPVAPPRLVPGTVDVLAQTSSYGWWSAHGPAPKGVGLSTNQFAALPSMHVGWAVWVALAARALVPHRHRRWAPLLWVYPATTAFVVVATGNHWVADVVAGVLVVLASYAVVRAATTPLPVPDRVP